MLTTMVENFPGFRDGIMGPELMADMRAQAERFGTEIIQGNVTKVDLSRRPFKLEVSDDCVYTETLIIATGASARLLGLPAERALLGHGVSTCATCDGFFFRGKPIAVVGGGDSALEEATLPDEVRVEGHASCIGATRCARRRSCRTRRSRTRRSTSRWNSEVEDILDTSKGVVTGVVLRDTLTGERTELPVDGVFVAIGHTPNTGLFAGQLEMDAQRLHRDGTGHPHERAGRVRVRRRAGSRLSPGDHGGRHRLHGGHRRRALSGARPARSRRRELGSGPRPR